MAEYQVLPRKYRPQFFRDVVGQETIVAALLNALKKGTTAHAYLFSGVKGTGKTTLARLLAKALNCPFLSSDCEPCNNCSSCKEISSGQSFDVLEIDGASHRGIEEMRQIGETVGYAPTVGRYKIYLIDEVHMLTKEAFNALLKILEEPPPKVKFFFATTEPHKIPPTILSRCQRFQLARISKEKIQSKLSSIAKDLHVTLHPDALDRIADLADGGLRDAESLLDQLLSFEEMEITTKTLSNLLGIVPKEMLFAFDEAGIKGNYTEAFSLARTLFSSGINLAYFIEELIHHFRTILLVQLGSPPDLLPNERECYLSSSRYYSLHQCLDILEILTRAEQESKSQPLQHIALEMLLVRILRTHQKISIETLISRLVELEKKLEFHQTETKSITEDPTPLAAELPPPKKSPPEEALRKQSKIDTLLRFAAKELDGSLKKD